MHPFIWQISSQEHHIIITGTSINAIHPNKLQDPRNPKSSLERAIASLNLQNGIKRVVLASAINLMNTSKTVNSVNQAQHD